jgi:uncharacterized protein YkwD
MRMRGTSAARVGSRLLIVVLATGCGLVDGGDEGAGESGDAGEGSEGSEGADGSSGDGTPGEPDVPATDYCAGVAQWPEEARAFETEVVVLVNQARAQGATCGGASFDPTGPLAMEARLRCAARVHSLDMAMRGFFDHVNPDGEDPFVRMERAGYSFLAAGENIAAGQTTPQEVVDGWLASPGHCSNIMSPDFSQIGVGYVAAPQGMLPHYWTQTFGTPF